MTSLRAKDLKDASSRLQPCSRLHESSAVAASFLNREEAPRDVPDPAGPVNFFSAEKTATSNFESTFKNTPPRRRGRPKNEEVNFETSFKNPPTPKEIAHVVEVPRVPWWLAPDEKRQKPKQEPAPRWWFNDDL